MPYELLHSLLPDIAEAETRTVILADENEFNLPAGAYSFMELFCNEKKCDCRRLFLNVAEHNSKKIVAVIYWGWETTKFYRNWMNSPGFDVARELQGPALNSMSYQSPIAPQVLKLFTDVLLKDKEYCDRIKKHYTLFRNKIDAKYSLRYRLKR